MNTARYSSIYGSDNTWSIPRRVQTFLPPSPAGATVDLDSTQVDGVSGIATPVYDPSSEHNIIYVPGVTAGSSVNIQIASWGTSQYSYPTYVGDTLRLIVIGDAVVTPLLGFFPYGGSSPSYTFSCAYYCIIDFIYLGDNLESALGQAGGWAMTTATVDGEVYND